VNGTERDCVSGLGTEWLRPVDFLERDGSGSEENIPFAGQPIFRSEENIPFAGQPIFPLL
jgi:hypothetical protein